MLKRVEQFLKHETGKARKNGIEVYWSTGKFLKCDGMETCGYFCEDPARLAVATGTPMSDWLPIFVHESCHLDQWLEKVAFWNESERSIRKLENWLQKKREYSDKEIFEFISNIIMLEEDCERRTVAKIKEWNLPIDIEKYIRGANVYLFFHLDLIRTRFWKKGPYMNKQLMQTVSKKFYKDYSKIPSKLQKALEKVYPII